MNPRVSPERTPLRVESDKVGRGDPRTGFDAGYGEDKRQAGAGDGHVPDVAESQGVCLDNELSLGQSERHAVVDPRRRRSDRVDLSLREDARRRERVPEVGAVVGQPAGCLALVAQ